MGAIVKLRREKLKSDSEIMRERIKAVARAMCVADGRNPDAMVTDAIDTQNRAYAYCWQMYVLEATKQIAAFQALHEFEFRLHHGTEGPYGQKALK